MLSYAKEIINIHKIMRPESELLLPGSASQLSEKTDQPKDHVMEMQTQIYHKKRSESVLYEQKKVSNFQFQKPADLDSLWK